MATVDPAAPGENYSLLIVGVSNGDGDGGGVDGDGSGDNSPSRQGAGTETSVPRILSSMAAALWTRGGNIEHRPRVFSLGGICRRKGEVGGAPRGPHHLLARPRLLPRHEVVWPPRSPTSSRLRFSGTFPNKN